MIKVAIVDDQDIVRQGIIALLQNTGRVTIVGEAKSGQQCLEILNSGAQPDVVLLDMNMPGMNGIETLSEIRKVSPVSCVIILTTFDEPALLQQAIQLGAKGWLLKDVSLENLLIALEKVARGVTLDNGKHAPRLETFTPREMDVVRALVDGLSNKELALQLGISSGTIKNHLTKLFSKLQVDNRTQAVKRAKEIGLI